MCIKKLLLARHLFFKVVLSFCLILFIVFLPGCQSTTPQDIEKIADNLYGELNEKDNTASVSVLVVKDGKKIVEKSYGHKNVETGELATPNTSYRLGCISKYFVSTSILMLKEQGLLELDWKVNQILKDFPEYAKDVTIADLMINTSRLPEIYDLYPEDGEPLTDRKQYEIIKKHPTKYIPNSIYSQLGNDAAFVILSLIVEEVSNQKYQDFLEANIFKPLGMNNSVALVEGYNSVGDRAYGTVLDKDKNLIIGDQYAYSATLGDGGVYSNINDMYLWDQAIDKHQLISQKTFTDALKMGKIVDCWYELIEDGCFAGTTKSPAKFSCGWYLISNGVLDELWTEGGSIGFYSIYVKIPEKNLSVIILSNLNENYRVVNDSNLLVQEALKLPDK